jgi:hypothetical protein
MGTITAQKDGTTELVLGLAHHSSHILVRHTSITPERSYAANCVWQVAMTQRTIAAHNSFHRMFTPRARS